jgi:hypothetical protein
VVHVPVPVVPVTVAVHDAVAIPREIGYA